METKFTQWVAVLHELGPGHSHPHGAVTKIEPPDDSGWTLIQIHYLGGPRHYSVLWGK